MQKRTFTAYLIFCLSLILMFSGCFLTDKTNKELESKENSNDLLSHPENTERDTNKEANEEIMRVVESIQRFIPETPDKKADGIQKVEFVPDKDLYMYIANAEQPTGKIDEKELANFKSKLVKEVSEEMNWYVFRKHSVTIHFKFHDKDMKKELYEIVVTPEDYK